MIPSILDQLILSISQDSILEPLHCELKAEEDKKMAVNAFGSTDYLSSSSSSSSSSFFTRRRQPIFDLDLLKIMGDYPSKKPLPELIQTQLELGINAPKELWRDELFIHVLKQLTQNKSK